MIYEPQWEYYLYPTLESLIKLKILYGELNNLREIKIK